MKKIVGLTTVKGFYKLMKYTIITSVIIAIIGLIMICLPEQTNRAIGIFAGLMIILNGSSCLYKYFKRDGAKLYSFNLAFGILTVLIGILVLMVPTSVATFLTVMLGLYLIILGANKITYGVWFKIGSDSSWLITVTIGAMLALFGILVIANPFSALTITKLVGTFLLISSALDLIDVILLTRRAEKIVKIFW